MAMNEEARETVKALRMCPDPSYGCYDCPVFVPGKTCQNELKAADLIESLSAQLDQVTRERDGLSIMLTSATSAAETYKRERDAAVKDIEELRTRYFRGTCHYCKHHGEEYISNDCMDCHGSNWQWRGVEKEVEG